MRDFSVSNPGLHKLYVGWAMHHLQSINNAIAELDSYSNLNLLDIVVGMKIERAKLINEDAAYRDAAALLMAETDLPPYVAEPSSEEEQP